MSETSPDQWVDAHGDLLYRFALSRLRDPVAAEDVVQETFLAALKARDRFAGQSSERSWLVGILKHKLMDSLRRKYRDQIFVAEGELEEATSRNFDRHGHWDTHNGCAPKGWGSGGAGALASAEFRAALDGCLENMPPQAARAFALRELDDRETGEICKVLNITATHLWVVLHRARTLLRRCLEKNWFKP